MAAAAWLHIAAAWLHIAAAWLHIAAAIWLLICLNIGTVVIVVQVERARVVEDTISSHYCSGL